jgi:hypothetical protein
VKKGQMKAFREYLNSRFSPSEGRWRNNKFVQRKRLYGDYLYYQDRALFDECLKQANAGSKDYPNWPTEGAAK